MLHVGDSVRHSSWRDTRRVGRVARVYVQVFEFTKKSINVAEVEWPRPEGNLSHDARFLERVDP